MWVIRNSNTGMTPKTNDLDVKKLINLICRNSEPIFLPVTPENYAIQNECFPTVQEKIRRDGGEMILGWQIWKGNFLIEAEFHAVWKAPDGSLSDITPKNIPIEKILFLPDKNAKYTGNQVDNIRLNITDNPLVDDFIEVAKAIFRVTNKGELAKQHGEITLCGQNAQIYHTLLLIKSGLYKMLLTGCTKNSICFCGRGIKYRYCHGKDIRETIKNL